MSDSPNISSCALSFCWGRSVYLTRPEAQVLGQARCGTGRLPCVRFDHQCDYNLRVIQPRLTAIANRLLNEIGLVLADMIPVPMIFSRVQHQALCPRNSG